MARSQMPQCIKGRLADLTADAAMHECVAAISACGASPIVRIAANESWMVKRELATIRKACFMPLTQHH